MDFIESFRSQMFFNGINFTGEIIADGTLHRFHVEGDAGKLKKNGWYVLYGDGIPSGAYGCWKRSISKAWCSKFKESMSSLDWVQHEERISVAKEKRDEAKNKARTAAKEKGKSLWDNAYPASDEHPYLKQKEVKSHGIRCQDDNAGGQNLVIPLYSPNGIIQSIQFIYLKGTKRFLRDGEVSGGYFPIGRKPKHKSEIIGIGEGYCTCAQAYEILGCNMVCAFNCGNIPHVARLMREKHPHAEIFIFADNDQWPNEKGVVDNRGLKCAYKAAEAIGAKVIYPDFTGFDVSSKPTDWNDLALIAGVDEARRQLLAGKENEEPQPLPEVLSSVLPFNLEMLPKSIRDYVADVAARQQCPVDFVAVTAVCGLAVALGNKASIRPKQKDDWTITPNLWGAIIGRPSAMKSPAMRAALEPLKLIQSNLAKEYESEIEEYHVTKELAKLSKESATQKAKKELKASRYEAAKTILQAVNSEEQPPKRKRLIVNDATIEKLGELLNENSNGLILVRDELSGWLCKLAKEEFQGDRAFYLECYNGSGQFTYDRIGRGTIDIKNLTLSVIGGIQPSKIAPLIRDAIRGICDDGLVQRLQVTAWPEDNKSWEWVDRVPNEEAYASYVKAFNYLHTVRFKAENGKSCCFRFTLDAQELFIEWMNEVQNNARADDTHPALESHLLKMPETVASLALIFEILEGGLESVGEDATACALEWGEYLQSHAKRLYSVANQGVIGARLILSRIDKLNNEFSMRDILRREWTGLTEQRVVEEALLLLVDYKHLTSREVLSTSSGGRPTVTYNKNKKYKKEEDEKWVDG